VKFYQLTPAEVEAVNGLNSRRSNVLLIVCCVGEQVGVDADALRRVEYAPYLDIIGGTYLEDRVVELSD
jgi:hypothetical protein